MICICIWYKEVFIFWFPFGFERNKYTTNTNRKVSNFRQTFEKWKDFIPHRGSLWSLAANVIFRHNRDQFFPLWRKPSFVENPDDDNDWHADEILLKLGGKCQKCQTFVLLAFSFLLIPQYLVEIIVQWRHFFMCQFFQVTILVMNRFTRCFCLDFGFAKCVGVVFWWIWLLCLLKRRWQQQRCGIVWIGLLWNDCMVRCLRLAFAFGKLFEC